MDGQGAAPRVRPLGLLRLATISQPACAPAVLCLPDTQVAQVIRESCHEILSVRSALHEPITCDDLGPGGRADCLATARRSWSAMNPRECPERFPKIHFLLSELGMLCR